MEAKQSGEARAGVLILEKSGFENSGSHQKCRLAQMSVNTLMDKQTVAHPYNGILFSHSEGWTTATSRHGRNPKAMMLAERGRQKGPILYGSVYMKCPE